MLVYREERADLTDLLCLETFRGGALSWKLTNENSSSGIASSLKQRLKSRHKSLELRRTKSIAEIADNAQGQQQTIFLQVPLGSATPFAVFNESAKPVALLLDKKLQSKPKVYHHPLTNDATLGKATSFERPEENHVHLIAFRGREMFVSQ